MKNFKSRFGPIDLAYIFLMIVVSMVVGFGVSQALATEGKNDTTIDIRQTHIIHFTHDNGQFPDLIVFCENGIRYVVSSIDRETESTYHPRAGGGVAFQFDPKCPNTPVESGGG